MDDSSPLSDLWTKTFVAVASPEEAPRIPDVELLRRIGRGAYGEVWLARTVTGAFRAVKIVRRSSFEEERPFEREFEGIRRFEPISRAHDSQIDILHVGRGEDYFYYIVELADDQATGRLVVPENYRPRTLKSDLATRHRLGFDECLEAGVSLATALGHLHQNGLVHRDVKPANVIFVDGRAKLADIGLVTDVDKTRSYVGTEGFAAPEGPGTAQADIFSLGKVLYEIATGKDRQQFPELPTNLNQSPEHGRFSELNVVIVRSCQHDPRDRYRSAKEMLTDLELLRQGRSLIEKRRLKAQGVALAWVGTFAIFVLGLLQLFSWARNAPGLREKFFASSKQQQDPQPKTVQWPVSKGGNGHWYEAVPVSQGLSWDRANTAAEAKGGHLVDILSAEENEFVFRLIDRPEYWSKSRNEDFLWSDGPWIGAWQANTNSEPAGQFVWSRNGSPLVYANWQPGQPDNRRNEEHHVKFFTFGSHERSAVWNDSPGWTRSAYVIEYDSKPSSVSQNETP